jgi:hypothetical protein
MQKSNLLCFMFVAALQSCAITAFAQNPTQPIITERIITFDDNVAVPPDMPMLDDKVYPVKSVEQRPEFPGGEKALFVYLAKYVKYPSSARESGYGGRVFVQFIVEKRW